MIIQVENTVSDNDCRRLMTIYDQHVQQAKVRDQTGHPLVYWDELRDAPYADEIIPRLVRECLRDITSRLQPADPLYPETVILAALAPQPTCGQLSPERTRRLGRQSYAPARRDRDLLPK